MRPAALKHGGDGGSREERMSPDGDRDEGVAFCHYLVYTKR